MHSKSEISNFKLLVHPIEHDIYLVRIIRERTKEVRAQELISRKAGHLSIINGILSSMCFNQR